MTSERSGEVGSTVGSSGPMAWLPGDGTGAGCFRCCVVFSWTVLSYMSEIPTPHRET